MDHIFDLPDLAFWAPSVRRRIHDNGVVGIAAAYLTFYKLYAVIHQPTDGSVLQSGRDSIFLCPSYHAPGGVHMGDLSACGGCRKGGSACVGEKVQHFDRASRVAYLFREPVPV